MHTNIAIILFLNKLQIFVRVKIVLQLLFDTDHLTWFPSVNAGLSFGFRQQTQVQWQLFFNRITSIIYEKKFNN